MCSLYLFIFHFNHYYYNINYEILFFEEDSQFS